MGQTGMARRAFVWLLPALLTLILAFGAAVSWRGPDSPIAHEIGQRVYGHAAVLANAPLDGGNAAPLINQWNDNDDPDDILQASVASIPVPALISGVGRRIGSAVARQHLVSSAFPRGPPAA